MKQITIFGVAGITIFVVGFFTLQYLNLPEEKQEVVEEAQVFDSQSNLPVTSIKPVEKDPPVSPPKEVEPIPMTLDMKTWTWVKTIYNNDTEFVPKQIDAFTLIFHTNGTLSVDTDCNDMFGDYVVDGNDITSIGPFKITLLDCGEASQENTFASMLEQIQSYHFTDKGELVFDLKFDSGVSIFE